MIKEIVECFLIIFFHDKFIDIQAEKIRKRYKTMQPENLLNLIKEQNNIIYYKHSKIETYSKIENRAIFTIIKEKNCNHTFDILYSLLKKGSKDIKSCVESRLSSEYLIKEVQNFGIRHSDIYFIQKWLKETFNLDAKFLDFDDKDYKTTPDYIVNESIFNYSGDITSNEVNYDDEFDYPQKINYPDEINTYSETENIVNIEPINKKQSNKKIKLESCNRDDLLTIDGFDEEKADKYIKERDNGKIYYDIETFVSDYKLQPHQMVEVQDRLEFPAKPKNKIGRKIDW